MTTTHCSRCGHETAGTRKVRPDLCGPCYVGKPVGWWRDLPTVLRRIGAAAALTAWGFAGGGSGCSSVTSTAIVVPFTCGSNAYHWGAIGSTAYAYTEGGVEDCEWNGINDGPIVRGYPDDDEADPLDPRALWEYFITPEGKLYAENYVWSESAAITTEAWTIESRLNFNFTEGTVYHVGMTHAQDACVTGIVAQINIDCVQQLPETHIVWDVMTGDPLPTWTAAHTEVCRMGLTTAAFRSGADPSIPLLECGAEDTFWIWR